MSSNGRADGRTTRENLDRRTLLKLAGAGVGSFLLGSCTDSTMFESSSPTSTSPPPPLDPATFDVAPSVVNVGTPVVFTDTTPGSTSWRWTFGDQQPSRRLIKTGWDNPTPKNLVANLELAESRPFHGVCIELPDLSPNTLLARRQTRSQVDDALAPLRDVTFVRLTHNFVYCVIRAPAGENNFHGEREWATATQNFADLAASAVAHGMRGIFLDNEQYYGDLWTGPASDQALAFSRGRDLMAAAIAAAPDIEVMAYLGGWFSHVASRDALIRGGVAFPAGESEKIPNLSPFFAGMVHATMGTNARIIDGNELYSLRSALEFKTLRNWAKDGVAESAPYVPDEDRSRYADTVSISFGIYDRPIGSIDMNPEIWRSTLQNALAACDHYVWIFSERFTWLGTGPDPHPHDRTLEPVTQDWLDATSAAYRGLHATQSAERQPTHTFVVPGPHLVELTAVTPDGDRFAVKRIDVEP
jgi:hypothetical protein